MRPTRLHAQMILIGVAIYLVFAISTAVYARLQSNQIEARASECVREQYSKAFDDLLPPENREKPTVEDQTVTGSFKGGPMVLTAINPWSQHGHVCDPDRMRRLMRENPLLRELSPPGAQGLVWESVKKQDKLTHVSRSVGLVAALLATLLSLPFVWYFMLARMSDLSKALRGRK
jgi:hypothetical protein